MIRILPIIPMVHAAVFHQTQGPIAVPRVREIVGFLGDKRH